MINTKTARYRVLIKKPGLQKGSLRAVFAADLHNSLWNNDPDFLPDQIAREKPDLILLGGDIITAKPGRSLKNALAFMKRVVKIADVYFAFGNHEYRSRIYPETYGTMFYDFTEPLLEAGVRFLDNENAKIQVNGIPLELFGLSIPRAKYQRFHDPKLSMEEMTSMIGRPDDNCVSILLAHNPKYYQTYLDWGADLTLCGHYHGGIMSVGKHTGLISPDLKLFPKNAYGRIRKDNRSVIITSGAGEHTIPVRIRNPREFVTLEIRCGRGDSSGRTYNGESRVDKC